MKKVLFISSTGGLSEKTIKDITIIVKGSIKKGINEDKRR